MAIIYESKEDVERHSLKEQANRLREDAALQSHMGTIAGLGGVGGLSSYLASGKKDHRWVEYASWGFILLSLIQSVRGWFTAKKARELDKQGEKLGPENVILAVSDGGKKQDNQGCPAKTYTQSLESKTLLEHATKPDSIVLGK